MLTTIETCNGRFSFRHYQAGDETRILSLWRKVFGREMTPRLWQWKYLQNPQGSPIVLCESEAGEIVAMCSGLAYRANLLGQTVSIMQVTDSMSDPIYRGVGGTKGLFVRTAFRFIDDYLKPDASIFAYGFPGERHYRLGNMLLQYEAMPGGACFLSANPADLAAGVVLFDGRLEPITIPDFRLDELAETSRRLYPFAVLRDSAFLRWRFLQHPENRYELWGYGSHSDDSWQGYAVFSLREEKALLVDFLCLSREESGDFLARLGAVLAEKQVQRVEVWLPAGHFLPAMFQSAGFRREQEPLGIVPVGRSFDGRLSVDWALRNLFYTMADGDLF